MFLFVSNHVNGGEIDKKLYKNCIYPTIYVGQATGNTYGSGVIVRSEKVKPHQYKNVFLTCGHVVNDSVLDYEVRQYIYEDYSQIKEVRSYPAIFNAVNHEQDVAIGVFYSDTKQPVVQLDFNPKLYIGNEVYRIGCGVGEDPRLDYGKLTLFRKNALKPYMRTSVMTVPGDSGSPLFHEYKVVGIVVAIRNYHNLPIFSISYAIPLKTFQTWSKSYKNAIDYAWDDDEDLPELPFYYLKFKEYEMK
jgi:S1-C subfamily serine protease